MKRLLMTALLASTAAAAAQSWTKDDPAGTLTLKGCYVVKEGVRCDMSYTLTDTNSAGFILYPSLFGVVTTTGQTVQAKYVSVGGNSFTEYNSSTTAYRGVAIQGAVLFDLPASTTSLRVLAFANEPLLNVPVARSVAATTPVVTTPPPSAGIPTGFSLDLRDCKVNQGVYTCMAVLTPTR
ncbi:hypothetical protein [Deinococcus aquaticus]|uniref:hypothetical protein n=1 Tax=Deinococcus aquaticus TaxID=328692 RepID=UPI003F46A77D